MTKTTAADIFQRLTDQLVESIENDPGDWSKPWRDAIGSGIPGNATTGVPYRGGNIWSLALHRPDAGGNVWATYKQWKAAGCQVRKDEGSVPLVIWVKPRCRAGHAKSVRCPRCSSGLIPVPFHVFHMSQVEGGAEYVAERYGSAEEQPAVERIDRAERFIAAQGARITHSTVGRAFYSPKGDFVNVPEISDFHTSEGYYSTLLHELTHWTGHRSRCARVGITEFDSFGSPQYAQEELIAELGSVLVGVGVLGLEMPVRTDHAAYLKSWLKILKADPKILHRSLTKASDAATWLMDNAALADESAALADEAVSA